MAPSPRQQSTSSLAPLAVRDFRLLFLGFVASQALMPLQVVTLIFWVQENADADVRIILVGVVGSVRGLGALFFTLVGGALADRFDRRRLLIAVQSFALLITLAMALQMTVSSGDALGFALLLALAFLASATFAIDIPTRQAMVPEILGPRLTSQGIALNTAGMQLALPLSIFGVGLLIEALGFGSAFALSAVGHLLALALLLPMEYRSGPRAVVAGATAVRRTLSDIALGMGYTRRQAVLLWVIVLLTVMMALGFPPTANLGPTWITTVVGASFAEFGFIALTWGLGAFLASLLLTRFAAVERQGVVLALGALTFAGAFVLFVAGQSWPFAVAGNFGLGVGFAVTQVSATALIAHHTPNEMRGRVLSLLMVNIFLAQALSLPVAAAGQAVSLETLFPILSYVCLGAVAAVLLMRRQLWRIRVVAGAPADRDGRIAQSTGGRMGT